MIQRIQTLYLLLSLACAIAIVFVFNLWDTSNSEQLFVIDNLYVLILFALSGLLSVISIFSFKNRQSQFVMGRLNIILNFFLLGLFVYQSLTLPGETVVSEKGIWMLIPIFSIVCLALANKAIKKDETLVKSVDRLR